MGAGGAGSSPDGAGDMLASGEGTAAAAGAAVAGRGCCACCCSPACICWVEKATHGSGKVVLLSCLARRRTA